jgi:hypothetical protein
MHEVVLGVDPDTTSLGWALLAKGRLYQAGLVRAKNLEGMIFEVTRARAWTWETIDLLVVERAEIYPHGEARPNDLSQLLIVAGTVAGYVAHRRLCLPYPKEWKKQVPKEIHHRRLLEGLTQEEHAVLDAALRGVPMSLRHNVLDAVGLAKWGAAQKSAMRA